MINSGSVSPEHCGDEETDGSTLKEQAREVKSGIADRNKHP